MSVAGALGEDAEEKARLSNNRWSSEMHCTESRQIKRSTELQGKERRPRANNISKEWNALADVHHANDSQRRTTDDKLPRIRQRMAHPRVHGRQGLQLVSASENIRYAPGVGQEYDDRSGQVHLPRPQSVGRLRLLYHMMINLSNFKFQDAMFEDFVDTFVSDNFGYGDYFEHVAAGYAHREEPNVLFLTYEELKKNTREVVLRLAYFLGEQHGRDFEKDEAFLQRVLERSKPEYMRNVVVVDFSAGDNPQWNEAFSRERITCIEGHEGEENKYSYVRNGKVGCWKDHFSPALLRKMEHRILEAEKRSSFMDLWKDIRVEARKRMQDTE